jgi:mxaK protein
MYVWTGIETVAVMSTQLVGIMRRGVAWAVLLLLLALVMLMNQSVEIYRAHVYRNSLQPHVLITNTVLGANQTAQALFGNAVFYDDQLKSEQALSQYAALLSKVSESDALRKQAYYNSGNIYMRTATRLLEQRGLPAWDEAGPLVALAKESYQKALRIQPDWSEAKYNYHLALRLSPTTHGMSGPQQYEDEQIKAEEQPSGWPAMPGNPRGMP